MGGGTALKYLLANWKMHTTVDQAVTLIRAIQEACGSRPPLRRPHRSSTAER